MGKHIPDSTRNTKHCRSFKKLMLIQSTSEACIVLDLHCPTPTNQHKPVAFWVVHPPLQVLLTHPLTVPTSPRYTDIRVLPSEQFFPKPLYLCWNSRHQSHLSLLGQQEHPTALHLERTRTTSYPTVTGQVFVTGTRCSEGRAQQVHTSTVRQEALSWQCSTISVGLFPFCQLQHSNSHTPLLSTYTRVRLLEKHLSSLKIDLRVTCTSILEMNHPLNEVQLRSFQRVNTYYDPIIIYVN